MNKSKIVIKTKIKMTIAFIGNVNMTFAYTQYLNYLYI